MDYNYIRMRNAIKAEDSAAAEKYRRLYEDRKKRHKRTWPAVLIIVLLVIAAALGTYILIINGGERAINDKATQTQEPVESPAVVTEPEPAENISEEAAE
ncbi:MAG: hypothetical protein IJH37_04165 [Clostridia bacterium]|nr:hypothetical protein [Clostridia bacterium]